MIGEFSSQNLFLHYSLPATQETGPFHGICSSAHHLLQILSVQHRFRHVKNSVFLSEGSKNLLAFRNFALLETRPFFFPIPLGALLRASEDLFRITTPLPGSRENRFSVQKFFNRCGMDNTSWSRLLLLQYGIRHLLQSGQIPSVTSSSFFVNAPFDGPFWIDQSAFFIYIFTDCQPGEISIFRNKYLNLNQNWIPARAQTGMSDRKPLHLAMYMFFFTIRELSTSVNHNAEIHSLCLKLTNKCIDFLADRLSIFRHPSLISCLADELFMFSGLICNAFSYEREVHTENTFFNYLNYRNGLCFIKVFSNAEWHLRYQTRFLKDSDLCSSFFNAYTPEGRSSHFLWPQSDPGIILEPARPLFQEIFSYWLTACHNKISPFLQAHNNLSLCPSPRHLSLAALSAIKILEQGSRASDTEVCTSLSLLLRDDEETSPGDDAQSFVTIRALFYKYHSEEIVRKCIEVHLLRLEGYINTSSDDQAKACCIFLLQMTAYCEISFTSFHRIQLTRKLLVNALIQFGSPLPRFTVQSLLDRLMLLFSTSRCNLLEIIPSYDFWRSVIQLFAYKENSLREAKLKRLYEDEGSPSSAKRMRLS